MFFPRWLLPILLLTIMQKSNAADSVTLTRQWAERAFAPSERTANAISVEVVREDSPGDTKAGKCATGTPLSLGGIIYQRGIGTNSNATLRVQLPPSAKRLQGIYGPDDNVRENPATVGLKIVAGGKVLLDSGVLKGGSEPRPLDLALDGVRSLEIMIVDGGDGRTYDQMSFADLRVVKEDGSVVYLDECFAPTSANSGLQSEVPFSFTYGGQSSRDFLPSWTSELKEEKSGDDKVVRTLTFSDPTTKLEVCATATIFLDHPGVDWTLRFTNRGEAETPLIENLKALDVSVSPSMPCVRGDGYLGLSLRPLEHAAASEPLLLRLTGTLGGLERLNEFMPLADSIPVGFALDWGPKGALPAFDAFPFFTLDWGGAGSITAVGWTGQWSASLQRSASAMHLQAGLRNLRTVLKPGESIRSPRILQMFWQGGDAAFGQNLFRQTMFAHILPKQGEKTVFPPLAHTTSSWKETNTTTDEIERSYIDSFAPLGFETYWLDAWWFEGGHPKGIGNWGFPLDRVVAKERFPGGPRAVADYARGKGLSFLLWFAPEYVHPDAVLGREHPEWMLPKGASAGVINLGLPEARDFLIRYNNAAIQEYGVNWWRTDNHPELEHWKSADTDPNRQGLTEMRYVEGLYGLWDGMLKANPGLVIDNCALGGTRLDLETASRSVMLWRSDSVVPPLWNRRDYNVNAIQNQVMNFALNRYVPLTQSGSMGTSPYLIRSAFNGGLSFGEDTRPPDYPRSQLAEGIAECKRLRKYLTGDFYPILMPSESPDEWCVYQYHRAKEGDGCVFVFRRHESPYRSVDLKLRGIDPSAVYLLHEYRGYQPEPARKLTGAELLVYTAEVPEKPGSLLLEYVKQP